MFKIMRSLRSSKCLKTTVELTFTTQKANACSPWTVCSVFDWKYLFWVNLFQRLKIISLSWNFEPRIIVLFLFSTGNTFLDKFGPKNLNCQFELKLRTRLIWICRIMYKICGSHFFCFWPEKTFWGQIWSKRSILSV